MAEIINLFNKEIIKENEKVKFNVYAKSEPIMMNLSEIINLKDNDQLYRDVSRFVKKHVPYGMSLMFIEKVNGSYHVNIYPCMDDIYLAFANEMNRENRDTITSVYFVNKKYAVKFLSIGSGFSTVLQMEYKKTRDLLIDLIEDKIE